MAAAAAAAARACVGRRVYPIQARVAAAENPSTKMSRLQ